MHILNIFLLQLLTGIIIYISGWELAYKGVFKWMKDRAGMAHLAHLLQTPGKYIHAAALRHFVSRGGDAPTLTSAGEVLGTEVRGEIWQRISTIDTELAEAERNNDLGRQDSLTTERASLLAEVRSATGLGGRRRMALDENERARKYMDTTIRRILRAMEKIHPELWKHLSNTIKIGEFLSYQPDQLTYWTT